MAKSIMHEKDGSCYLCMRLNLDYDTHKTTEEHHVVFGVQNRTKAEHYGLKVYLCHEHHTEGKYAVHKNYKIARMLQNEAQMRFEAVHPELDWMSVFGRNYKQDEQSVATSQETEDTEPGFRFLEEEEVDGTQESRIQRT